MKAVCKDSSKRKRGSRRFTAKYCSTFARICSALSEFQTLFANTVCFIYLAKKEKHVNTVTNHGRETVFALCLFYRREKKKRQTKRTNSHVTRDNTCHSTALLALQVTTFGRDGKSSNDGTSSLGCSRRRKQLALQGRWSLSEDPTGKTVCHQDRTAHDRLSDPHLKSSFRLVLTVSQLRGFSVFWEAQTKQDKARKTDRSDLLTFFVCLLTICRSCLRSTHIQIPRAFYDYACNAFRANAAAQTPSSSVLGFSSLNG